MHGCAERLTDVIARLVKNEGKIDSLIRNAQQVAKKLDGSLAMGEHNHKALATMQEFQNRPHPQALGDEKEKISSAVVRISGLEEQILESVRHMTNVSERVVAAEIATRENSRQMDSIREDLQGPISFMASRENSRLSKDQGPPELEPRAGMPSNGQARAFPGLGHLDDHLQQRNQLSNLSEIIIESASRENTQTIQENQWADDDTVSRPVPQPTLDPPSSSQFRGGHSDRGSQDNSLSMLGAQRIPENGQLQAQPPREETVNDGVYDESPPKDAEMHTLTANQALPAHPALIAHAPAPLVVPFVGHLEEHEEPAPVDPAPKAPIDQAKAGLTEAPSTPNASPDAPASGADQAPLKAAPKRVWRIVPKWLRRS